MAPADTTALPGVRPGIPAGNRNASSRIGEGLEERFREQVPALEIEAHGMGSNLSIRRPSPLTGVSDMVEGSSRPYVNEVDRLVAQAAAGDARAFEALYRLHSGRVYALCLRLSGDREQAEELAQLAFVRAWRKLHTFRGESAFATWMHRLTVNVALETLRADRRRADRVVSLDDVGVFSRAGQRETPGDKVDLEAAIARLPERARLVFVLFQIEGYQHEEIANLTGMAVGSSKAQLHRARQLLREMLAP